MNLRTIFDTLSWYKTWLHNGYNPTHVTRKLLRKHKRACRSSWSQPLTIRWNLAKLVKICRGIIIRPHLNEQRQVRRIEEGTSAVLLQSGLDEKWWADSMECDCYLRNIQDLLSDGKTPYDRRFGKPFIGPVIPFGAMVEYHPISAKDQ